MVVGVKDLFNNFMLILYDYNKCKIENDKKESMSLELDANGKRLFYCQAWNGNKNKKKCLD